MASDAVITDKSKAINLTILDRSGSVMQSQQVFAVTSVNQKGPFDVLPEHENFISIIKDRIIVHKTRKDKQEIKIETGILEATSNNVKIFLGLHPQ